MTHQTTGFHICSLCESYTKVCFKSYIIILSQQNNSSSQFMPTISRLHAMEACVCTSECEYRVRLQHFQPFSCFSASMFKHLQCLQQLGLKQFICWFLFFFTEIKISFKYLKDIKQYSFCRPPYKLSSTKLKALPHSPSHNRNSKKLATF